LQPEQQLLDESAPQSDSTVYSTQFIAPAAKEPHIQSRRRSTFQPQSEKLRSSATRLKARTASLPTTLQTQPGLPLPAIGFWNINEASPEADCNQSSNRSTITEALSDRSDSPLNQGLVPQSDNERSDDDTATQQQRGRRAHRDAEKLRRESLRIGFEKLKDLLPAQTIGMNKSWSQAKLLESGLEYIERLKEESAKQERDQRKLKEAIRRLIMAQKQ
ncbi:UNVERIFIED_CONTAM: hypothetical protein HDU68_004966, partial [Siphonaria sp. JEL0065]